MSPVRIALGCIALGLAAALFLAAPPAGAAGFQYGKAPDPDDQPIELAIWYPSDGASATQPLGLFEQNVAFYAPVKGHALPLVVISHGTGGSAATHYDTALALADAGFVVVAPSHTGDNYKDHAYSFTRRNFIDRPKHVSRVIDFMLDSWTGRSHLDAQRIMMFGHSAGAATALIVAGAEPDYGQAAQLCRDHPEDWGCRRAKERQDAGPPAEAEQKPTEWHHDPRVKAISIAAPALGGAFTKEALAGVSTPVQLWRAEDDKITPNPGSGDRVRDNLPKPAEDHYVAKAGHFDFLAPCSDALAKAAPEICQSEPGFDRAAFHQDLNQAILIFFGSSLPSP